MRSLLILTLALAPSAIVLGADNAPAPAPAPAPVATAANNTTCPDCGKPVNGGVLITAHTKDDKLISMRCCSDCAAEVRKNPDQYADAAVVNKQWKKEVEEK